MRDPEVTLRRDFIAMGLDDIKIRALMRSGTISRIRQGAYVDAELWRNADRATRHQWRSHAVLMRAVAPSVLSHASALVEWGAPLWRTDLDRVHVTRPSCKAGRREAGVVQHRGILGEDDVHDLGGWPVTSATRTALDASIVLPREAAFVVLTHFLHHGLTTTGALQDRYDTSPDEPGMEKWPGSINTKKLIELADPRCETPLESRVYFLCWAHGLPMPIPQFEIFDSSGRLIGRVDFAWPEYGLFLEADGKVKYTTMVPEGSSASDVVIREKIREDRIREVTGWHCIRVTWADLANAHAVATRLREALRRAA